MITVSKKENCCGCGACAQACPRGCITMAADSEGFLYPQVDEAKCVHCDACNRVCPMEAHEKQAASVCAYAAYTDDASLRQNSSSGGIFSVLAQWVLENQGVVFGAAFDEDFSVYHRVIQSPEELGILRGSKYLQSRTENTYSEVKQLLESGCMVLYTGVACQIAGLKRYLKKEYPLLFTADVLCHGVPSPLVWQNYLRHQEALHNSSAESVNFRGKTFGWKQFSMEITFRSGETYCVPHGEDPFMNLFLENICLRPSCHSCRFKGFPRSSDLTLGDAWGIDGTMPEMDDDHGTSLVLVNSKKGRELLDQISGCLCCKPGELDVLLPVSADSRTPVRPHPRRNAFFTAVAKGADLDRMLAILKGSLPQRALGFAARLVKDKFIEKKQKTT
ncbi:MAG: Coenzyme F420 hydrogenase/dehydrogenase, beta subunit C-terminal domain [Faecousia sp.]